MSLACWIPAWEIYFKNVQPARLSDTADTLTYARGNHSMYSIQHVTANRFSPFNEIIRKEVKHFRMSANNFT